MLKTILQTISVYILPLCIIAILLTAFIKKVPCYETFIEGAKDGFKTSISLIPYLVAIMVAISMFRASGAIDLLSELLGNFLNKFQIPIDSLPIMFTRSLSGSATIGLFSEIATKHGAEDYATKMCAVMVGSSETTFYVLSVYFGAIGILKFRHAIITGLLADAIGIILAITISRFFFL
ncbi:spore maturation protein [bacterium]|nr:spore maturation protein [bacterium]